MNKAIKKNLLKKGRSSMAKFKAKTNSNKSKSDLTKDLYGQIFNKNNPHLESVVMRLLQET